MCELAGLMTPSCLRSMKPFISIAILSPLSHMYVAVFPSQCISLLFPLTPSVYCRCLCIAQIAAVMYHYMICNCATDVLWTIGNGARSSADTEIMRHVSHWMSPMCKILYFSIPHWSSSVELEVIFRTKLVKAARRPSPVAKDVDVTPFALR